MAHLTPSSALFAGDVTLDLTMGISHVPAPDEKVHASWAEENCGGVVANAAVACRRAGAAVRLLAQAGEDRAAAVIMAGLAACDVELDLARGAGATCRVVILLEPHGEKRLLLHPGVSLSYTRGQAETVSLDGVGWVHTAVYDLDAARVLVDRCRRARLPWSLDLEPATFPSGIASLARHLDGAETVFCNDRAAALLGADPAAALFGLGVRTVVRTRGAAGATVLSPGVAVDCPAPRGLPVTDTTGAGDCLAGWFIAERLQGRDAAEAIRPAVMAATMSCARPGTHPSYPQRDAVEAILATLSDRSREQ